MSSCSLDGIESEQKPLSVNDLNTRLLTQNFAWASMNRVERAADSISKLAEDQQRMQLNALYWKIQTSLELGNVSFQTEPRIALIDTWSYFLGVEHALENPQLDSVFGNYKPIAMDAVRENIAGIEKIASRVLSKKEYDRTRQFVEDYAQSTLLPLHQKLNHQSIRDSYLRYNNIPDSIAVQTVGTLSEVVADAINRFSYFSEATGKRINWRTEMMFKEQGIDSLEQKIKLAEIEAQFDRLLLVAKNAPETIEEAIIDFRENITPLFRRLNYQVGSAMDSLESDVRLVDEKLLRQRIALDSIMARERLALTSKADELVEKGIENAFDGLKKTLRGLIIYFILLFLVVLGLPFYLGYFIGRRRSKDA